ncbi:DUF2877 domain-containing protein [Bacillus sp. Bva_UNVM-123]
MDMNNVIFTQSGDIEFIERINRSDFHGFVHSVFNRTFNIKSRDNEELFTVASREVDNAPNTLIIDTENFKGVGLLVNELVVARNQLLHIGNKLTISIENSKKWASVLPNYPKDEQVTITNLRKVKEFIDIHGKGGGVKLDLTSDNLFAREVSRVLHEQSRFLLQELSSSRIDKALQHAVTILGLGPGLTPSGDDFLVGLFTAFYIKDSPYSSYQSFCKEVVKKAKTLTNEISYMALEKASIGKVRESIIQLVHSIINGSEEELILSLNKVLTIGSSSGTDIALGLVAGLEANLTSFSKKSSTSISGD